MPFPKNQSLLLPMPSKDRAPRSVRLTIARADRIRSACDARFPRTSSPVRALHNALDDAEATRTVRVTFTPSEAITLLHTVVPNTAPDAVHTAHEHIVKQLRAATITDDTGTFRAEVCLQHARTVHEHHRKSQKEASQVIAFSLERAKMLSRTVYATLPWDAALVVDTLATLDPNNDALRAATAIARTPRSAQAGPQPRDRRDEPILPVSTSPTKNARPSGRSKRS